MVVGVLDEVALLVGVLEEGELGTGDPVTLVSREAEALTIDETVRRAYGV